MAPGGPDGVRVTQVGKELEWQNGRLAELGEVVDTLEGRLSGVLTPTPADRQINAHEGSRKLAELREGVAYVPVAGQIHNNSDRLNGIINRLKGVLDRLEV